VTKAKPVRSSALSNLEPEPAAEVGQNRGARWSLVETHILEEATSLFAGRGFASTSMQDIAGAAGLTRSALYHYFANKEAVLSRLVSDGTAVPAKELAKIRQRTSLDAVEKLRAMAYTIAYQQATRPDRFKVLVLSESELPESLSKAYYDGRRLVLKEVSAVIEAGTRAGVFRPVDARVAALGVIGLCNWVAWWHRPAGETANSEVARTLAEMAVASLAQADPDDQSAPLSTTDVLGMIKKDLAKLEHLLG
jgi:AcrR family transcriptional regulator